MKPKFLSRHWAALAFAFVFGCAVAVPQLIAIERLGGDFQGIFPTNNDDELYYLARVQDVIDGHSTVAQPYLWEGKGRMPLQFWIPDYAIAKLAQASGLGLHQVFILLDFILPATIFLLTYSIALLLSMSRLTALAATVLLCFGMHFTLLNRPISPQLNLVFLLGFILSALRWVRFPSSKISVVLGISFGLLFHVYAYYWTYAVLALASAFLGYLVLRDTLRIKQLVVASTVAGIIALPYFFQLFRSFNDEFYIETVARVGMIETHMPSGVYIVGLAAVYACFLAILLVRKKILFTPETILVSALVFSAPIATNQHLITGQNLEFSSHYRWLASFVSVFGYTYLVAVSGVFNRPRWRWLGTLTTGVLIGYSLMTAGSTVITQSYMRQDEIDAQRYAQIFAWLKDNAKIDDVVFAPEELSRLIPVYSSQNVFSVREANLHYMSDAEVKERFLVRNYFEPHLTQEDITDIERSVWGTYYINRWQHAQQSNILLRALGLSEKKIERFPEAHANALLDDDQKIKSSSFGDLIAPYRVDYLVWDTKNDPEWRVDEKVKNLQFITEIGGGFRVYRIP